MLLPPLALYIHIPWCIRKCPYCDFNSHAVRGGIDEQAYVQALLSDLNQSLPMIWGRSVSSVFIGGGTPSLFSADGIARLMDGVRSRLKLLPNAEITLEANPGAVDANHFAGYVAAGINRLSIGVQSFNDTFLRTLGRVHGGHEAVRAYETARQAGFENINLDLMFGLPEQTPAELVTDLEKACSLTPDHLSVYQLTLEPNTHFYHSPPAMPPEDILADMQQQVVDTLELAGYQRYEVSAYARYGMECRHNRNYWEYGDYLGIGAGAHGKISLHDKLIRQAKLRHPDEYLRKADRPDVVSSETELGEGDRITEFMMNAFRLRQGFDLELFSARTGLDVDNIQPGLEQAKSLGLVTVRGGRAWATEKGFRFLNDLLILF